MNKEKRSILINICALTIVLILCVVSVNSLIIPETTFSQVFYLITILIGIASGVGIFISVKTLNDLSC